MRGLDSSVLTKNHPPNTDWPTALVVNLSETGIEHCMENDPTGLAFQEARFVLLSRNHIAFSQIHTVWHTFPELWWVDLSHNLFSSLSNDGLPSTLGYLDLRGNSISIDELQKLRKYSILRINTDFLETNESGGLNLMLRAVPLAWVINDQFITSNDREIVKDSEFASSISPELDGAWRPPRHSSKEGTILNILNRFSSSNNNLDNQKIDILLEDYIEHVILFNEYCNSIAMSMGKRMKPLPLPPKFDCLMDLSHRYRLDLSVLLTASILFDIPSSLLVDASTILLKGALSAEQLTDTFRLPAFIRTAIVSILRRISRKEFTDLRAFNCLRPKPVDLAVWASPFSLCSYESPKDFYFLRTVKSYLEDSQQLYSASGGVACAIPFSDLEMEILKQLPDCPTTWSKGSTGKRNDWIAFTSRHAVFLLSKSPSCPPLTRAPKSLSEERGYLQLLPLLRSAQMTLRDLDICISGPEIDGRNIKNLARAANLDPTNGRNAKLAEALQVLGPSYLPFSAGLPRAAKSSLRWSSADYELPRSYPQPWSTTHTHNGADGGATGQEGETVETGAAETSAETQPRAVLEAEADGFFVTDGEIVNSPGKPRRTNRSRPTSSRGPVYRLESQSWEVDLQSCALPELSLPLAHSPSTSHDPLDWLGSHALSRSAPSSPTNRRAKPNVVEEFPPEFRPHSRSKTDLKMMYPLPPSRPDSPARGEGVIHNVPKEQRTLEEVAVDDAISASKSVLSISLPSIDKREGLHNGEDFHLSREGTPRRSMAKDIVASVPPLEPAPPLQPALLPGELRTKLLVSIPPPSSPDRDNTHDGHMGSPAKASSRPSSSVAPRPVEGFSADGLWEPNFLLAPNSSVEAYNATFRTMGVTGTLTSDMTNYWRPLDRPPVVLMDRSPFAERVERAMRERDHRSPSMPIPIQESDRDALSIDDSVELSEVHPAPAQRTQSPHAARSALRAAGGKKRGKGRKMHTSAADDRLVESLATDLLRSMGTLRNVNALETFNERVRSIRLGAVRRSSLSILLSKPLSYLPMAPRETVPTSNDEVFLTSAPPAEDGIEGDSLSLTMSQASSVSPMRVVAQSGKVLSPPSPSRATVARNSSGYDLVFSAEDWEERAVHMTGGPGETADFHPVWPKATLRVDLAHSLSPPALGRHLQSGGEQIPGINSAATHREGARRSPLTAKGRVKPRSADPQRSPILATSGTSNTERTIHDPSPESNIIATNLDVIRSNPFLKQSLLKSLRAGAYPPRTKDQKEHEGTGVIGEDDAFSTVSSSTFEHAGFIYEAYHSQVFSGPMTQTPSLLGMDHSLTHSRLSSSKAQSMASSKVSKSASKSDSKNSSASAAMNNRRSMGSDNLQLGSEMVLGRSSSSAHIISPLVLTSSLDVERPAHHKAATHKLALNRSFRMKLPSLERPTPPVGDLLLAKSVSKQGGVR